MENSSCSGCSCCNEHLRWWLHFSTEGGKKTRFMFLLVGWHFSGSVQKTVNGFAWWRVVGTFFMATMVPEGKRQKTWEVGNQKKLDMACHRWRWFLPATIGLCLGPVCFWVVRTRRVKPAKKVRVSLSWVTCKSYVFRIARKVQLVLESTLFQRKSPIAVNLVLEFTYEFVFGKLLRSQLSFLKKKSKDITGMWRHFRRCAPQKFHIDT